MADGMAKIGQYLFCRMFGHDFSCIFYFNAMIIVLSFVLYMMQQMFVWSVEICEVAFDE